MIFDPMVRSTQTVHLSCFKMSTMSEMPKWASTWASSPSGTIESAQNNLWAYGTSSANHAPILHQPNTVSKQKRNEIPTDQDHLADPSVASKTISMPMVHSTQTMHLSCVKISTLSKRTESSFYLRPRHLGVPSGASKMISEPMVHLTRNRAPILHWH